MFKPRATHRALVHVQHAECHVAHRNSTAITVDTITVDTITVDTITVDTITLTLLLLTLLLLTERKSPVVLALLHLMKPFTEDGHEETGVPKENSSRPNPENTTYRRPKLRATAKTRTGTAANSTRRGHAAALIVLYERKESL